MSTLKIVVNWDLCESNGLCVEAAPKVFELADDDSLIVHTEHPGADQLENVRAAVRRCPKAAIRLVEE
jgi:ferredoxin